MWYLPSSDFVIELCAKYKKRRRPGHSYQYQDAFYYAVKYVFSSLSLSVITHVCVSSRRINHVIRTQAILIIRRKVRILTHYDEYCTHTYTHTMMIVCNRRTQRQQLQSQVLLAANFFRPRHRTTLIFLFIPSNALSHSLRRSSLLKNSSVRIQALI